MTPILSEAYIRHVMDENARVFRARMVMTRILPLYGVLGLALFGFFAVRSGAMAERSAAPQEVSRGGALASEMTSFDRKTSAQRTCTAWHQAATAAIDGWSATDGTPAQVADANFRLRRAQRNCAAGWFDLACSDYETLVAGPPPAGDGKRHRLEISQSCSEL